MNRFTQWALIFTVSLFFGQVFAAAPSKPKPSVYFISPTDGQVVNGQVKIQFGLKGMGVAPAGVQKANTGHHHLLIDLVGKVDMSKPLPANKNIKHFGGGQTEATLTLPKGKHTLQLLLGDFSHTPHKTPIISKVITITVK